MALYSDSLSVYEQEISNKAILESLALIRKYEESDIKILKWDKDRIAIPLLLDISIPPFKDEDSVDIKSKEPIILVFNLARYPTIAPRVYPDRDDFPKAKLGHLYVAVDNQPPAFCLVRGNYDEWYSNRLVTQLISQVRKWLHDAALNRLQTNGDSFEPIRLEGYHGSIAYDYSYLYHTIQEASSKTNETVITKSNLVFAVFKGKNPNYTLKTIIKQEEYNVPDEDTIGFIIWSDCPDFMDEYDVNLPFDWITFKKFCKNYKIHTDWLKYHLCEYPKNGMTEVPIIVAIKRSKNIIGFDGNIEFINFSFFLDHSSTDKNHVNNFAIKFNKHDQILTSNKAKEISGFVPDLKARFLVVGCGAIGSKVVLHLVKCGTTNFILSDPDKFSPHNFVRHGLHRSFSSYKAVGLCFEANALFPEDTISLEPFPASGELMLEDKYSYIFDFTASHSFFNTLTRTQLQPETKVCSAYLTNSGSLGIILFEGPNRNPRIDDIQVILYNQYKANQLISTWLKNEMEKENNPNTIIEVGVGCSSETTVLADDIISFHSAFFSSIIKQHSNKGTNETGEIYLNEIQKEPYFHSSQELITIPAFDIYSANNDQEWEIRIASGILDTIGKDRSAYLPNETGGIFIGSANHKTKTIHVIDLIEAPTDSIHQQFGFQRGINGIHQKISEIENLSGGKLGFIGEWHSHPDGYDDLSTQDYETITELKLRFANLDSPLPVFVAILTDKFIPFVF